MTKALAMLVTVATLLTAAADLGFQTDTGKVCEVQSHCTPQGCNLYLDDACTMSELKVQHTLTQAEISNGVTTLKSVTENLDEEQKRLEFRLTALKKKQEATGHRYESSYFSEQDAGPKGGGTYRSGDYCENDVKVAVANDFEQVLGGWRCDQHGGHFMAHNSDDHCVWESLLMGIKHNNKQKYGIDEHGYHGLKVRFQYKEAGELDLDDYAAVKMRVCRSHSPASCRKWDVLSKIHDDIDTDEENQAGKKWSVWRTYTSEAVTIMQGHKYVQVEVELKANAHLFGDDKEYQQLRGVEVLSDCS